jgi:general secretion pathway protein B
MVWVVAVLSFALAGSIAWHFLSRDAAPVLADATAGSVAPAPTMPMAQATTTPTVPVQQAVLPPVPAARPDPLPAAAPGALPAVPAPAPTARNATPAAAASPAPLPAPAPAAIAGTSPPNTAARNNAPPNNAPANTATAGTPAPAAANTRLPTQDELPEDIRRQLPKFSVGGSIYSESAASRFLILNGQIFHENDKVMPDLVLEQIKLKSAVLRYRDRRFTIAY